MTPSSSQPPYNVCLIGLGRHGLTVLRQLARHPQMWHFAAVVDRAITSYARFQQYFHERRTPFYRDPLEAISSEPIDAVLICTTAPSHVSIASALIEAGYEGALLIEKPISNMISEAVHLVRLIEERQWRGRAAVDFNRRCSGLYSRVHEIREEGALGKIVRIEFNRPCKLSMVGMHFIDLANWLIGERPVSVTGRLDSLSQVDHRGARFYDPPGRLQVHYPNGAVFEMNTLQGTPQASRGMTIWFEKGQARINNEESRLVVEGPFGEQQVEVLDENRRYRWIEKALTALVHETDVCDVCPLSEAVVALEVVVAAHLSHERGGEPVSLPLSEPHRSRSLRIA